MTPPIDQTDDARRTSEAELRAHAAAVLAGGAAAVLASADGRVLAANAAAGLSGATRLPAETTARLARIAATLRPGRPRLERLRLPGGMSPVTLACTLITIAGGRAVLLTAPGAAPAAKAAADTGVVAEPLTDASVMGEAAEPATPSPELSKDQAEAAAPAPSEPALASPDHEPTAAAVLQPAVELALADAASPVSDAASEVAAAPAADEAVPAVEAPEPTAAGVPASSIFTDSAPTSAPPARWFWRTDPQGRLRALDPRLASALGTSVENLAGRDFAALGAPELANAVLAGGSFARLEARLATADGAAILAMFGGVPMRGDGMRGYALLLARETAAPAIAAEPPATPAKASAEGPRAVNDDQPGADVLPAATVEAAAPPEDISDRAPAAPAEPTEPALPASEVSEAVTEAADTAPIEPDHTDRTPHEPDHTAPTNAAAPAEPAPVRVMLSIVPSPPNVVPLRVGAEAAGETMRTSWAGLSAGERNAFREIARALGARLEGLDDDPPPPEPTPAAAPPAETKPEPAAPSLSEPDGIRRLLAEGERPILDRLPLGVLAYRGDELLYANKALLEWSGHADLPALEIAGGLASLFRDNGGGEEDGARVLTLMNSGGDPIPVEARLMSAPWDGGTAMLYILRRAGAGFDERLRNAELALREAEATARELRAILDTATDGVVLIDAEGVVLSMNRSAEALFGYESNELQGESFTLLFAPESRRAAVDYLDGLASNGVASVLNDGREVVGRVREGGLIPLFMTVGRIGEDSAKFCAVLRDITQWKRAEEELTEAKRLAEKANLAKSDFLAKISHEIRTPLNAIIGFSEVMMEERFGPIENQRYRDYLRDIHASGGHLISLINDLLDLSKIEAGKLDLAFTSVALNEIVQQCMAIMQGQANRERIIIRSQLAADLPPVVADPRSMRQIVLNLVSNSIKFSRPGDQVILSTALTEAGEVVLRVRDTGIGMSEGDIATAMEPFRQLATSGRAGSGGTGLGLPLTKALAEANRATFSIRSAVDAGTLVEITFPSTRVLAE